MRHRYASLLTLALACAACDTPTVPHDAAAPDDAASASDAEPTRSDAACVTDADCDDGLFCNGIELCDPSAPGADARGCAVDGMRCPARDVCDEDADRCLPAPCAGDSERITAYRDEDADGYGDATRPMQVCPEDAGPGNAWVLEAGDCDDVRAEAHPGATESCDRIDNDCDGSTDEGLLTTFHRDADGDGYGCDPSAADCPPPIESCTQPGGYVNDSRDCNDTPTDGAAQNPDVPETCNGVDDDCDGSIDIGSDELGSREHCSACFDDCQFSCNAGVCEQAVEIDMSWDAQCATTTLDNLYCWGANSYGAVGDGTTRPAYRPVRVLGTPMTAEVESMSLSGRTSCAVTRDASAGVGSVYCWGHNDDYQVLDTGTTRVSVPTLVGSNFESVAINEPSSGIGTTCASRLDGGSETGHCWGAQVPRRDAGGGWSLVSAMSPLEMGPSFPWTVRRVVDDLPCTLSATGQLSCWGHNTWGELGSGATVTWHPAPAEVSLAAPVSHAVESGATRCAQRGTEVWCWGSDSNGGLGDGPLSPERCGFGASESGCSRTPVRVSSLPPIERVFGDEGGFCARDTAGEMYCWGVDNRPGVELLPGLATDTGPSHSPVRVPSLDRFERLVMGRYGACGVDGRGDVYCWGNGASTYGTGGAMGVTRVLPPAP